MKDTPFLLAALARQRQLARQSKRKKSEIRGSESQETPVLSPTQQAGLAIEEAACEFLANAGLTIVQRNRSTRWGEIDIVAVHGNTLVFCEVRFRRHNRFGSACDTVTTPKQQRLIRTAHALLPGLVRRHFDGNTPPCRFDVLGHDGTHFTWLQAAFNLQAP